MQQHGQKETRTQTHSGNMPSSGSQTELKTKNALLHWSTKPKIQQNLKSLTDNDYHDGEY